MDELQKINVPQPQPAPGKPQEQQRDLHQCEDDGGEAPPADLQECEDDRGEVLLAESFRPGALEVFIGTCALFAWIGAFSIGILIPTTHLREAMYATVHRASTTRPTTPVATTQPRDDLSVLEFSTYLVTTTVGFTVSNLLFLSVLAAYLGCMMRRWSTPFIYPTTEVRPPGVDEEVEEGENRDEKKGEGEAEGKGDEEDERRDGQREDALTTDEIGIREVRRAYSTAVLRGFLAYALMIAGYLVVIPENSLTMITPGQYIRLAGFVTSVSILVGFEPRTIAKLLRLIFAGDTPSRRSRVVQRR
jgi:hypothetical protein